MDKVFNLLLTSNVMRIKDEQFGKQIRILLILLSPDTELC
jgi:hypothetical protein